MTQFDYEGSVEWSVVLTDQHGVTHTTKGKTMPDSPELFSIKADRNQILSLGPIEQVAPFVEDIEVLTLRLPYPTEIVVNVATTSASPNINLDEGNDG